MAHYSNCHDFLHPLLRKGNIMNKEHQEIMKFWGNSLVALDPQTVENQNLSQETKNLLCTVGIPENHSKIRESLLITFYEDPFPVEFQQENYLVIGDDYGTKIGIKKTTEEIYSIKESETRFINSNIEVFLKFLQIYISVEFEKVSDEDIAELINGVEERFNHLDSKSLEDEENWWPVILEQIEEGFM